MPEPLAVLVNFMTPEDRLPKVSDSLATLREPEKQHLTRLVREAAERERRVLTEAAFAELDRLPAFIRIPLSKVLKV